jgi:hypothetical protein
MNSITITIGNSDNKLTQEEWSYFVGEMHSIILTHVKSIHFSGGSNFDRPWQNACWVCETFPDKLSELLGKIIECREGYRQDSVAVIMGNVQFI